MTTTRRWPILGALLALCCAASSCRVGQGPDLPPYRCVEDVHLQKLIEEVGLPQAQPGAWGVAGSEEGMEGNVFDLEQEATLKLDQPAPFLAALCRRLESQLAERCEVRKFWPGTEHCAASVETPMSAITGEKGKYAHRAFDGRVNLFASPGPEGTVHLVLTASEWAG